MNIPTHKFTYVLICVYELYVSGKSIQKKYSKKEFRKNTSYKHILYIYIKKICYKQIFSKNTYHRHILWLSILLNKTELPIYRKYILHIFSKRAQYIRERAMNMQILRCEKKSKFAHVSTELLQHTATYCNILLHTATYCNILQHTAIYTQHTNIHYETKKSKFVQVSMVLLQHTATRCNTLQHRNVDCKETQVCPRIDSTPATLCNTLQHPATHCNTLQHTATYCNTQTYTANKRKFAKVSTVLLQHTATHCNTLQHRNLLCKNKQVCQNVDGVPATYCNTLQHTATHCNTETYTAEKSKFAKVSTVLLPFSYLHKRSCSRQDQSAILGHVLLQCVAVYCSVL